MDSEKVDFHEILRQKSFLTSQNFKKGVKFFSMREADQDTYRKHFLCWEICCEKWIPYIGMVMVAFLAWS